MASREAILKFRMRNIEVEHRPVSDFAKTGDLVVTSCGSWKGIRTDAGRVLVHPVYDDVEVVPYVGCCVLRLGTSFFLCDLVSGRFVETTEPLTSYTIKADMGTIVIETVSGRGLFSCRLKSVVVPPGFAEVTFSDAMRYLWVRKNDGSFAFYDTAEDILISCPSETEMCLEGEEDRMFVKVGNEVRLINSSGIYEYSTLRDYALRRKGRIRLSNHNFNGNIIADIYGHIIN